MTQLETDQAPNAEQAYRLALAAMIAGRSGQQQPSFDEMASEKRAALEKVYQSGRLHWLKYGATNDDA